MRHNTDKITKANNYSRRIFLFSFFLVAIFFSWSFLGLKFSIGINEAQAAVPIFQAAGTAQGGTGNVSPGVPAGYAAGDVFLLFVESANQTTTTVPAGYTTVSSSPRGTGELDGTALEVYYKVATASESAPTVVDRGNHTFAVILNFRGVATSTLPWDVTSGGINTTTTNLMATGATTTVDDALVVVAVANQVDSTAARFSNWANVNLSSITERFDAGTTQGNGGGIGIMTGSKAIAGNYNITNATSSNSRLAYLTIALKPPPPPPVDISQNAYRWFENVDSADLATIYENPSAGFDSANAMVLDSSRGVMYVAGQDAITVTNERRFEKRKLSNASLIYAISSKYDGAPVIKAMAIDNAEGTMYLVGVDTINPKWIIEKRNLSDGSLVYSISSNLTTPVDSDQANTISLDTTNGVMYIGGSDGSPSLDSEWRIEKRYLSDGSFVTSFGTSGAITENPTAGRIDGITALAIDTTSSVMYIIGKDTIPLNNEWRIEKRSLIDGSLVTSFGANGIITSNLSAGVDIPNAISLDTVSGAMYIVGKDAIPGNQEWRIEKRNLSDGSLVYAVTSNPSFGSDEAMSIALDIASSTMYVAGYDSIPGDPNFQWRIEKRNLLDGSLVSSPTFGVNGVFTIKPNAGGNVINAIALDKNSGVLYAAGYDTTPTSTDVEIHLEKINANDGTSLDWGSPIAPQNTSTTAPGQGIPFRLRMLLGVSNNKLPLNTLNFKLQFAQRSGSCDAGFVGESYFDVGASTAISYYDNPYPLNGASLISTATDLTYASESIVNQTYVESNSFTNGQAIIPVGADGKWDFSLVDSSSTADTSYCFRVVKNGGTLLNNYNAIPEIKTRGLKPAISSASNQIFTINQAAAAISPITITSGSGALGAITSLNGIRIQIASSSVNMQWDTTRQSATLSGSAVASTSINVSYPDPYTLTLNATSDWSPGGNLTISNLAFTNFNSVNDATSSLLLYVGGLSDLVNYVIDDKSVSISGSSILTDYASGQEGNLFEFSGDSISGAELYRFVLAPTGENNNVINTSIDIFEIGGFAPTDISNPRLYLDLDGNGTVDIGEPTISATGTVSINNQTGIITFVGVWTAATTNNNIIMKVDVSNIAEGNYIKFSLSPSKIKLRGATTIYTITPGGGASNATHAKPNKHFGGGGQGKGPEETPPEVATQRGGGQGGGKNGSKDTESEPPPTDTQTGGSEGGGSSGETP